MSTVARVTQISSIVDCLETGLVKLDSSELDIELLNLFKSQLIEAIKYFQAGLLTKYEPELLLALRYLVWKHSVLSNGATLGQQMLNIAYRHKDNSEINRIQRILFGILTVFLPWLKERLSQFSDYARNNYLLRQVVRGIALLDNILTIGSLANFFSFLQTGRYKNLLERILSIHPEYSNPQSLRQEFLAFVLPLVNIYQTKMFFKQLLWSELSPKSSIKSTDCAFCGEIPCNIYQASCGHRFCYYCIKSRMLASVTVNCPSCGRVIRDHELAFARD
ncbi:Peroxisome biogenesis factor 2 [Trichoplax sp. H2]|nr:Peroxisome biogenesis factor 2 [Trichoplax sp. H2]|eukprot:RDD40468.1 Peroxisome biogenesis factor 2 [Trichoplax sp. H2]